MQYIYLQAFQNLCMMVTSSFLHIFCTTPHTSKLVKLNLLCQCYRIFSLYNYVSSPSDLRVHVVSEVFLVEMEPGCGCLAEFFRKILQLFCERRRSTIENSYARVLVCTGQITEYLPPVWSCKMCSNLAAGDDIHAVFSTLK